MSETKNTISDLLARLVIDVDNMNAFLYSLEKILESQSENVSITQKLNDGSETVINVPSFGYLKGNIDAINQKFDTLISANSDVIGIKSSNGDVRKFELKKVSKLVKELEEISETNLTLPTTFNVKNNWFFESFLNPLLYVGIDVATILTDDIDSFSTRRIIINSTDDDQIQYFDDNYKNVNDISIDNLITDLEDQGIDYFEDDNVYSMETAVNRFKGSFDVTKITEEEIPQTLTSTGETVTVKRKRYRLSTLNYIDIIEEQDNTKFLAEGDTLITSNDSEYKVLTVDVTNSEVVLERIFGIEPINIGPNVLMIKPNPYRIPELQVSVGYNERQVIFIRPISKSKNLTVDEFSNGFGIFTNELTISLEDDSTATLEEYYNNFVSDFGLILLNSAKERKIPSIIGEVPSAPVVEPDDFKVYEIDSHIKESEGQDVDNKISQKEAIKAELVEKDKEIDSLKAQLNDSQKNQSEKNRIDKKIKTAVDKRKTLQTQLSTTVKEIGQTISTSPVVTRTPKYRVRGFWDIPEAKVTQYGSQEIAQFKVRYRYLSKKGTSPNALQSTITKDGVKKSATFSPWNETVTKARTKELDETTGLYRWKTDQVTDADEVNTNQLDIPIKKGETVEIQIKSISEAGWPDNPVESEWSDSIQVPFPEDLESSEDSSLRAFKIFSEESRLDFEDELNSRGLDLHLGNQFTTGERFFSHLAKDISSGFFTSEGNVIDLFEQLQTYKNQIESLQQAITLDRGVIKVSIIDPLGNTSEVKNGETLKLFSGYYRDDIKDTSGGSTVYNEGEVITKQYVLSVENTSATPLELVTLLKGGVEQVAPDSDPVANPDQDYHVNRRYDLVPISVNSEVASEIGYFSNEPGFQSAQVQGQYVHSRFKNYGLSQDLNAYYPLGGYSIFSGTGYEENGISVGTETVPLTWGHYLPFKPENAAPTYPSGGSAADIWNGTTDGSGNPNDGGYISEFCIHVDHPGIENLGVSYDISTGSNLEDLILPKFKETLAPPAIDSDAVQVYLPFSQAVFSEISVNESTGVLGQKYFVQSNREISSTVSDNSLRQPDNYPIKLGFDPNDEYLIGKYTCGSYLHLFPNAYSDISVEGNHPTLSLKKVEFGTEQSINIPILFQYRCSDKLGNVGGWRVNSQLNNIKYSKKIGIDIFVKDDVPFSFDLEIGTQYKKETTLSAPVVPSRGNVSVNF
jgi:hypothetical protein